MTVQMLANGLLIIALIGWIGYKQLTWRAVDLARMWQMPALLALGGIVILANTPGITAMTGTDIAVLLIEIAISVGVGALMGVMATFRPLGREATDRYAQGRRGRPLGAITLESRTGVWGLVLWVALIAVRIGIDVLASMAGSELAASTGVILIVVAANRAARVAVFSYRVGRIAAPVAQSANPVIHSGQEGPSAG